MSKSLGKSVVDIALDIVLEVLNNCDNDIKKGFRARTRHEATDVAFQGLRYTLAVVAARSSANALEEALKGVDPATFIRGVCKDRDYRARLGLEGAEDVAYAIYGYSILYILRSLGLVTSGSFADFMRSASSSLVLQEFANQAAAWLKRFAEAYIRA